MIILLGISRSHFQNKPKIAVFLSVTPYAAWYVLTCQRKVLPLSLDNSPVLKMEHTSSVLSARM